MIARVLRATAFACTALALPVALSAALSGCGFRPLYGSFSPHPGTLATFSSIYIEPIPDNPGYQLRNSLIDLLGASNSASAPYHLKITWRERLYPVAVQNQRIPVGPTATINEIITTRFNYRLSIEYQLVQNPKNTLVTKGQEDALSSYNVTASAAGAYATQASRLDAEKDAATAIASRLKLDLAIFLAHHPEAAR